MAKFISDYLDKYSKAVVGHTKWAFLDCMEPEDQLKVIREYGDPTKYIVVVFERNTYVDRCKELGFNDEDNEDESDKGFHTEEMEEEWLENNP